MPGMNGIDAARVISEEGLAAVILLTAFSQQDLIQEASNAGVLAYLVKPFQRSDLVPSIELALGRFKEISDLKQETLMLRESLQTRKLVDRAKGLLIDNYGLKEGDAYRYLQKKAMEDRTTMKAVAEDILTDTSPLTQILQRKWIRNHEKLMLLDGNSLVYRAFHALSDADMRNSNGYPTGAIYGFLTMLFTLLTDHKPDGLVVAFDLPHPTFGTKE